MEIIDNFLTESEYQLIFDVLTSNEFPWFYNDSVDYDGQEIENFQFTHNFIRMEHLHYSVTQTIQLMFPILDRLKPVHLLKLKANLNVRGDGGKIGKFHKDVGVEGAKTAIFYVNTNNGYTEFKSGEKIKSIANRMVIFDSNKSHCGVSCTDEKKRILINFNYIPESIKSCYTMDEM